MRIASTTGRRRVSPPLLRGSLFMKTQRGACTMVGASLVAALVVVPAHAEMSAEELAKLAQNGDDRDNGLGDITLTAFVSRAQTHGLIWGAGPVLQLPTHTHDLGNRNWGLGARPPAASAGP